jgi:hypothetical protein
MFISVDRRNPRGYTTALLDMVDEGLVDKDTLIRDLLGWMSESEVQEFSLRNDYILNEDEE